MAIKSPHSQSDLEQNLVTRGKVSNGVTGNLGSMRKQYAQHWTANQRAQQLRALEPIRDNDLGIFINQLTYDYLEYRT